MGKPGQQEHYLRKVKDGGSHEDQGEFWGMGQKVTRKVCPQKRRKCSGEQSVEAKKKKKIGNVQREGVSCALTDEDQRVSVSFRNRSTNGGCISRTYIIYRKPLTQFRIFMYAKFGCF